VSEDDRPGGAPENQRRQPVFLLPGVATALVGAMAAIHVASTFIFNQESLLQFTVWFGFIPVRLIVPDEIPGGIWPMLWTPFTHAFLHAGWDHLLINAAWLAIFATPVGRRYGAAPTMIVFLLSAAAGAALFAATTLPEVQILVGASGGVAGLTGAAVRFIFQPVVIGIDPATGDRHVLGRRLAPLRALLAEPRTRYFVLVWVALNAAVPLLPAFTGTEIQVAWQAHLGGFFAGLLMVGLFERRH
jgi:membrane associated rhomboid family serine protease